MIFGTNGWKQEQSTEQESRRNDKTEWGDDVPGVHEIDVLRKDKNDIPNFSTKPPIVTKPIE